MLKNVKSLPHLILITPYLSVFHIFHLISPNLYIFSLFFLLFSFFDFYFAPVAFFS